MLLDDALETCIILSKPTLVQDPPCKEDQSMWSLKRQLESLGWLRDSTNPSTSRKAFNPNNPCHTYLVMLLTCHQSQLCVSIVVVNCFGVVSEIGLGTDDVLRYEESGAFNHKILSHNYYKAIHIAMNHHTDVS